MPEASENTYSLENCKLGDLLGKGSVGSVFKAEALADGKLLAVKIMETTPFIEGAMLQSIIKSGLETQNLPEKARVVKIYHTGVSGSSYYIVMELYKDTLENLMLEDICFMEQKLEIAFSLAETLECVHNAGIVHGDLKPSNVLLDGMMKPYLNDFYNSVDSLPANFSMPHGTPKYMSPEQASRRLVGPGSDIYSFGVLFYELMTGRLPYAEEADSIARMLEIVQTGQIIPPSKVNKKIDGKLEAIILKLLDREENRYSNMRRCVSDLKAYLNGAEISIPVAVSDSFFQKIFSIFTRK
jgi:serine/threonine-protein kinase